MPYVQHVLIEKDMDKNLHKHLPMLLEMAHDRTEEGRTALAGRLSDVFMTDEATLSHKEETLVLQLINELLQHNNPLIRQTLIDRFADSVYAQRDVAARIARGPIEIAQGVLATNPNLEDDDLIQIVNTQSEDHAAAIALRKTISAAVADALVTTGSVQIMFLVAENLGAHLSPKAMDVMVEAARFAALLQKPILSRPELTHENAMRLFWWVGKDARRLTLERFGFSQNRLDSARDRAIEEKLKTHAFESFDEDAMNVLADWLEEREALDALHMPTVLRMGHYVLFRIMLSRLHALDRALVDAMAERAEGRMLAVLCRALGVEKGTFISIFLMARGGRTDEHIVHPHELNATLEAFDRLNPKVAKEMIDTWRVAPEDAYKLLNNTPAA